jgi:signal transduction histidine kinase
MGRLEREIGMDRLPVANGGRIVDVFQTGEPYITGRADADPAVQPGFTQALGIRSLMVVPLQVEDQRLGVLHVAAAKVDAFSDQDLRFLEAVARWVALIAVRAELTEQIAREAADKARLRAAEELMTILAHDIRNHLTPLASRLDIILRAARREGNQHYLKQAGAAKVAVNRLVRLTRDLMDAARLEQEVFSLTTRPVDLVQLVQETVSHFQTPHHSIDVRLPQELIVEVDPDRVRQVLENLVSNAFKHGFKGTPVVVELDEEMREDGQWAVITVRDEGLGIAPELLPRLFNRFTSGPASGGLGLGLYLAKGIADAHEGMLTVASNPGEGATFRLWLPRQ